MCSERHWQVWLACVSDVEAERTVKGTGRCARQLNWPGQHPEADGYN